MSITTEAELETAITNWLGGRTDLTARYPEWIALFEAYAARKLRLGPMLKSTLITSTGGQGTLPSDFLAPLAMSHTSNDLTPLEFIHSLVGGATFPDYDSGRARFYTLFGGPGGFIQFWPTSDDTYNFLYYATNTAISSTLNWLFTNFPDAYLWGALTEAHAFVADDQMLATAKARRDEIMNEVALLYAVKQYPPGTRIKLTQVTP